MDEKRSEEKKEFVREKHLFFCANLFEKKRIEKKKEKKKAILVPGEMVFLKKVNKTPFGLAKLYFFNH